METDNHIQGRDPESVSIPTEKEALVELLYGNQELRELLKEATSAAEGRIYAEERDRRYQREEAERITNIQGWLDEMGVDGLTVGGPKGAIVRSSWSYGMYQHGRFIGNIESQSHAPMTKEDVQLAVLRNKDKFD